MKVSHEVWLIGFWDILKVFLSIILCKNSSPTPLLPNSTTGDHSITNMNLSYLKNASKQVKLFWLIGLGEDLKIFLSLYLYVKFQRPPPLPLWLNPALLNHDLNFNLHSTLQEDALIRHRKFAIKIITFKIT